MCIHDTCVRLPHAGHAVSTGNSTHISRLV